MIPVPSGVQVWLATGHTDMRKGFDGLAVLVQETLKRNPHNGNLFVFRGRRGGLLKVLWHDGQGMCLYAQVTSGSLMIIASPVETRRLMPFCKWSWAASLLPWCSPIHLPTLTSRPYR